MECITRAQNNPLKTARKNWLIQRECQCEVNFLRPCSEEGSDVAEPVVNNQINPDCDNSAVDNPQVANIDVPVLGLAGCHQRKKKNEIVKMILQAMSTTSMPRSAGTGE